MEYVRTPLARVALAVVGKSASAEVLVLSSRHLLFLRVSQSSIAQEDTEVMLREMVQCHKWLLDIFVALDQR